MKKRFSVEVGMIIFIGLLVVSVSILGMITYQSLGSMVSDLKKGTIPNNKIPLIKQISAALYETESNVRAFYFTRDSAYLSSYYATHDSVNRKVTMLKAYALNDDMDKAYMDSINYLVMAKYAVMDEWIVLEPDEKITKELSNISKKLQLKTPKDNTNIQNADKNDKTDTSLKKNKSTQKKPPKKILKKIKIRLNQ